MWARFASLWLNEKVGSAFKRKEGSVSALQWCGSRRVLINPYSDRIHTWDTLKFPFEWFEPVFCPHTFGNLFQLSMLLTAKEYFLMSVLPYRFHHRVGRVLSFFSSRRRSWNSLTPLAAGECVPPHFGRGGGHTRLRERGWGVPIPTRGHTLWCSVYISTLLVSPAALHVLV